MSFRPFALAVLLTLALSTVAVHAEEELGRPMGHRHAPRPLRHNSTTESGPHNPAHHFRNLSALSDVACRTAMIKCRNSTDTWGCISATSTGNAGCDNFARDLVACRTDARTAPGCQNATSFPTIRRCLRKLLRTKSLSAECQASGIANFSARAAKKGNRTSKRLGHQFSKLT